METSIAAGALLHPVALAILATTMFAAVSIGGKSPSLKMPSPRWALARGLLGVFAAALAIAAASAYVTPDEARRFGVPPENYADALRRQFIVSAVVASYASLVGASVVGVPVVIGLSSRGWATVPVLVLASVAISLAFCVVLGFVPLSEPKRALQYIGVLTGLHALLALSFAVSIGLSWRRQA